MKLPKSLIESLKDVEGFDEESFLRVHESGQSVTSIRINPLKIEEEKISFSVKTKVPWSSSGYYLSSRPVFTLDPLLHAGAYYVQEASSMFLESAVRQLVDLSKDIYALDLCAAPGGKSTLIQSLISPGSVLVSNEIHKSRVSILDENLVKWGAKNVVVSNSSPEQFGKLPGLFDLLVVDAPCSGSGLFRKDPEAIEEWSLKNVEMCSSRQKEILKHSIPSLSDGGVLIYSTCSYSKLENEEIAGWCVEQGLEPQRLQTDPSWNIVEVEALPGVFGYRFYPDKLDGEGFFIAAFQKPAGDAEHRRVAFKKHSSLGVGDLETIEKWIVSGEGKLLKWENNILWMPERMQHLLPVLQKGLYIRNAGLRIGSMVREELIPDHALALSGMVAENIPRFELGLEDALRFLRREELKSLPPETGWHLVTYKSLPLGWIKSLGNRVNNYYPKEWRIRMKS